MAGAEDFYLLLGIGIALLLLGVRLLRWALKESAEMPVFCTPESQFGGMFILPALCFLYGVGFLLAAFTR